MHEGEGCVQEDAVGFFGNGCTQVPQTKSLGGGGGVLGDGLGALRDGVLGELTGEDETSSSLDLAGGDGGLARELGEPGGLESDLLKGVVDKRVHDRHGALGHTAVGVDLLEDLVDVRRVRLDGLLARHFWGLIKWDVKNVENLSKKCWGVLLHSLAPNYPLTNVAQTL